MDKNFLERIYKTQGKITKNFASNILRVFTLTSPEQLADLEKGQFYPVKIGEKTYLIIDGKITKVVIGEDYNFIFDKKIGHFSRWGTDYKDDPNYSPVGGEILDIEATTICHGGCPFCSPKGTKVNTPHGTKNIEKIKVGDLVLGFSIKNDHITIQKVEETYRRHYMGELICIETENGEILKLTPEHIVILKGGIEKQAKSVDENDEIISF